MSGRQGVRGSNPLSSTTQPQGFIGNTPQVFAGCLRFCPAENSFGGDTVYACDVGCVGYPVEHAMRAPRSALAETPCADGAVWLFLMSALVQVEHATRAPPFGTRKNALRRWRCSIFFLMPALVQARRGHKKNARSPHGAGRFCSLVPVVGLEPTRILLHRILSPARLPVSPHRRK